MASPFFGENPPTWTDMSNYVVHFTKQVKKRSAYDNMLSILHGGQITAKKPFGIAFKEAPDLETQKAVCFSEVPLHQLSRIADKRSQYGIVFKKDFVIHRHGNPILYAYKDGQLNQTIRAMMRAGKNDPKAKVWGMTPFVDAPGAYLKGTYFFEWEREWRKVGDFKFSVDDVECLIIPEKLHSAAASFFETAKEENLGPSYECPFIDPYWSRKKVKKALKNG
jgi:Putative abortive phage resistance protein AbiGi, antitoxin